MPSESRTSRGPARPPSPCDQPAITSGIAAFSAAVRAGSRLYCWKTNPMFSARNRVFARSLIAVTSLAEDRHRRPRRRRGCRRSPTAASSCRSPRGRRSATSGPRRRPSRRPAAPCTRWSPRPKCLVTPRIRTATSGVGRPRRAVGGLGLLAIMRRILATPSSEGRRIRSRTGRSAAEDHRRLEHDHPADAQQARQDADQDDRPAGDRQELPGGVEGQLAAPASPRRTAPPGRRPIP